MIIVIPQYRIVSWHVCRDTYREVLADSHPYWEVGSICGLADTDFSTCTTLHVCVDYVDYLFIM